MILVTGAAGFIGSNILAELEAAGRGPLVGVDWLGTHDKWRNISKRRLIDFVSPDALPGYLARNNNRIEALIHMGAISATTERDADRLLALNIRYTLDLWDWCGEHSVPFIYASSAATYGAQEDGLTDDDAPAALAALRPLNGYGWSKKATDDMILSRITQAEKAPPQWVGLKFFNVYGPNEYHKDDMKSVIVKLHDSVCAGDPIRLFKSYRPGIADGEQRRDFVYVKDCARTVLWFLENPHVSGIFNLGTGKARSFLDIARAIEATLGRQAPAEFIEMPVELRGRYQYFTQAEMGKLARAGCDVNFYSLEDGIRDYIEGYLSRHDRYR